jgi:hypothetical protein
MWETRKARDKRWERQEKARDRRWKRKEKARDKRWERKEKARDRRWERQEKAREKRWKRKEKARDKRWGRKEKAREEMGEKRMPGIRDGRDKRKREIRDVRDKRNGEKEMWEEKRVGGEKGEDQLSKVRDERWERGEEEGGRGGGWGKGESAAWTTEFWLEWVTSDSYKLLGFSENLKSYYFVLKVHWRKSLGSSPMHFRYFDIKNKRKFREHSEQQSVTWKP